MHRRLHRATRRLFASWPSRLAQQFTQAPRSSWVTHRLEAPLLLLASAGIVATAVRAGALQQRASASSSEPAAESSEAISEPESSELGLHDVYEVLEVLGHGHFATVSRGVHKETGEAVAIKAIEKGRADASAIRREVAILQKVGSHPNIVALRDVFETEDHWYLVMELVTGGELFERLVKKGPYSEKEASRLMSQMAEAIAWLHSQGVCHRDLKPENLLLSQPQGDEEISLKICDFGLSVALGEGTLNEQQGTWAYWAPEMWTGQYGKQVDMWSLGVILYILLSGRHPFDSPGRSDAQMRRCIQTGELSFAHSSWSDVSDDAKQLIRSLLRLDPAQRLKPPALINHPWVVGTGVSEVPIRDSDVNLKNYDLVRRKWSTALVASMHKQATIRKRISERNRDVSRKKERQPLPHAPGDAAALSAAANLDSPAVGDLEVTGEVRELLEDAFKEFDPDGKGYVLKKDLAGITRRLGQQVTPDELSQMIAALEGPQSDSGRAAGPEGKIHYQEYLRLASTTIKEHSQVFPTGSVIFREGDPSDYFYLITSGRVRRITQKPPERFENLTNPAEELEVGDYFGTSAILGSGERTRHSTMIAMTDVRVVRLGRDEFEAGHGLGDGRSLSGGASRRRSSEPLKNPPAPSPELSARSSSRPNISAAAVAAAVSTTPPHPTAAHRPDAAASSAGSSSLMPPRSKTAASAGRSAMRSLRFIKMMSNHEQRGYTRGDTLFREGEDAHEMYIITSGRVQVALQGKDGRVHTIGQRGAGEICGETSCLSHKPRNSTVTCVSDECVVFCISREDFISLVRGSWDVAQDLLAVSDSHEREKERRINFRRTRDEAEVTEYFNNDGFDRWSRIYSENGEVNSVQLDIRTGHAQTVDKVLGWVDADGTAKAGERFCDAGCGVGSLALPLAKRGATVSASDISAAMVKEATKRAEDSGLSERATFSTSDLEAIEGKYDTVTCIDVMIHYPQEKMAQMVSGLASKADKRLIISFAPDTWYYRALKGIGELFPGPSKATRAYLHAEEAVVDAVREAGFKISRTEMTGTNFYFSRLLEAVRE